MTSGCLPSTISFELSLIDPAFTGQPFEQRIIYVIVIA